MSNRQCTVALQRQLKTALLRADRPNGATLRAPQELLMFWMAILTLFAALFGGLVGWA
ncbi:MAG: hypothetical protein AB1716_09320 [Planctomycetota bacterium]